MREMHGASLGCKDTCTTAWADSKAEARGLAFALLKFNLHFRANKIGYDAELGSFRLRLLNYYM
jgi:hypothetical protein